MNLEKTLGVRFLNNGFEALSGRPENENPPNEWYYIEPWYKGKKLKGLKINLAPEVSYTEPNHDSISVSKLSNGWTTYSVLFSDNMESMAVYLSDLFYYLVYEMNDEPKSDKKQTMVIRFFSDHRTFGMCGFDIVVNQDVRNWIGRCTEKEATAVRLAMNQAFQIMFPKWPVDDYGFQMWVHEERFGLSVPGNCACLGVSGMADTDHGLNFELTPHNNDNFGQQMALLAGMAYIWQKVRES